MILIAAPRQKRTDGEECMRRFLLVAGLFATALGLLWIGQGTGTVPWPRSSFMVNQLQWAGYGAAMAGFGLVLIWESNQ
jgi:uncharacterized membrane protein